MRNRIWTIVVVSDDTKAPRTLHVSSRALRRAGKVTGGLVAAGCAAMALTVAHNMRLARAKAVTNPMVTINLLRDSLASLDRQTEALRVVAGMPDSSNTADDPTQREDVPVDVLIQRADQLSSNLQQVAVKLDNDKEKVARTPSIMPTAGWLTSQFSLSRFHPILHKILPHLGIDVAAPFGTTVVAPAAGTVIRAGTASGYGLVMEINHGDGIVTKYGHLSRFLVHEGQQVVRGQAIAEVGSSGLATGPHLHYEVHVNGQIVDPLKYVLPSSIPDPTNAANHPAPTPPED